MLVSFIDQIPARLLGFIGEIVSVIGSFLDFMI